jgi:hypothetical protein
MKKPRSDSKLKGLPEDRQEQIIAWTRMPKSQSSPGGLQLAREQLAADGIAVSLRALSEFVAWWELQRRFTAASSRARQIEELMRKQDPSMDPERVRKLGQAVFTLEAVEASDPATYVKLENIRLSQDSLDAKVRIENKKIALAERRVRVAERKLEDLKGILTDEALTPEQRELRMKQQFGLA